MFTIVDAVKVFLVGLVGLIIITALIEQFWFSWIIPNVARLLIHKNLLNHGVLHRKGLAVINDKSWKPNYFELRFIMGGSKVWNSDLCLGLKYRSNTSSTMSMLSEQVALLSREDLTFPQWVVQLGRASPFIEVRACTFSRKEYIPTEDDLGILSLDHPDYGPRLWSNPNWKPSVRQINAVINLRAAMGPLVSEKVRLAAWNNRNWVPSLEQLDMGNCDPSSEVRQCVNQRGMECFKEKYLEGSKKLSITAL